MGHEHLKTICDMRRELIRLHAYHKWKKNITKHYQVSNNTSINKLLKLVLERACQNNNYDLNGFCLFAKFFAPGTSFNWGDTEEGFNYWFDIFKQIRDKMESNG